ncbi:hypothetical protein L8R85_14135 [Vibrio splendidus]|uniref:Uncharacterized protein n=1 Tax=Vibrio splendidus TaxID=29497 RepID=A0AA43JWH4_VIBSP|nr:hypothetical protein [Vibrio splendidus]MDH5922172.1 hypothetical protein [Vibrio splendidus]
MRDRFSKDIAKIINAIADSDFVLQINDQFEVNEAPVIQKIKNTPKFYGDENIKGIDRFLVTIYGNGASILSVESLIKKEHCCKILKYMSDNGFIDVQLITDHSYNLDKSRTVIHIFRKFFLSEKGLELRLKIKSDDNSQKSLRLSRGAILISILALAGTGLNLYLNNERLEKQQMSICATNPTLQFCPQLKK